MRFASRARREKDSVVGHQGEDCVEVAAERHVSMSCWI